MATATISSSSSTTASASGKRPTISLRASHPEAVLPIQQKETSPFLRLPGELRNQIYELLLTSPELPALQAKARRCCTVTASNALPRADIHPAILSTCRQIHAEASPVLYARNTFAAHPSLLAKLPHLLKPSRPVVAASAVALIRLWHLSVRLDTDARFTAADAAAAFSHADSLELHVSQAAFSDEVDYATLRLFTDVRGVARARVTGAVEPRFARWLELVMMSPPDSADELLRSGASTPSYVECDGEDGRRMPRDRRARPAWEM